MFRAAMVVSGDKYLSMLALSLVGTHHSSSARGHCPWLNPGVPLSTPAILHNRAALEMAAVYAVGLRCCRFGTRSHGSGCPCE